jgi:hypothetical protein
LGSIPAEMGILMVSADGKKVEPGPSDLSALCVSNLFLSAGSLMTAAYRLVEEDPTNHYSMRIVMEGMPQCTEVDPECPQDVKVWYIDEANNWHSGVGFQVVSAIRKTGEADEQWLAEKTKKRKSGGGSGAAASTGTGTATGTSSSTHHYNQQKEFIMARYPASKFWKKLDHFLFCNQFRKDCVGMGVLDPLVKGLEKSLNFADSRVSTEVMSLVKIMKEALFVVLCDTEVRAFKKTVPLLRSFILVIITVYLRHLDPFILDASVIPLVGATRSSVPFCCGPPLVI